MLSVLQSVSVISGRTGFKCVTVRVEPGIGSIRNGTSPVAVIKALETLYVCPTPTMLSVLKGIPLCAIHSTVVRSSRCVRSAQLSSTLCPSHRNQQSRACSAMAMST
jgi:hypothetical protein